MRLARVTILVRNQDEALKFYTEKLGLEKRSDVIFGEGWRWLTVAPKGQKEVEIVLEEPNESMHGKTGAKKLLNLVGKGTTWVFYTDDCRKEHDALRSHGVKFQSPPQEQPYGVEAVFEDL